MMLRVRFKGRDDLLATSGNLEDTPLATREQFAAGELSYAHLCSDGKVRRYQEVIGTREDVEVIEEVPDVQPTDPASWIANVATDILFPPRRPW